MRIPTPPLLATTLAAVTLVPLLSACAPTAAETERAQQRAAVTQTKLDKALAGLTPGTPTSCMPNYSGTVSTEAYGPTILYKISRGLIYRTDTAGGCENMARGDILVTIQYTGRACQGDIARTVDRVARMQTGSCSFGPFVPYRKQ